VQVIPGETVDRLWFCQEEVMYWLPVTLNPRKASGYRYTASGSLVTSWYKTGFAEIAKFWRALKLFTEGLSAGQTVTVSYQVDGAGDDDAWTDLPTVFTTSPVQEVLLSSSWSVSGKRIRFRLTLSTNDPTRSPRVRALTLDAVTRVTPKKSWSVSFVAQANAYDLTGHNFTLTPEQIRAQIEEWSDSDRRAAPLLMNHTDPAFDNLRVFIDPATITPAEGSYRDSRSGNLVTVKILNMNLYEA
jgi:hypothetical protein